VTVPEPVTEPVTTVDPVDDSATAAESDTAVEDFDESTADLVDESVTSDELVDEPVTVDDAVDEIDSEPDDGTTPPKSADFRLALVSSVALDLPNQHPTVVLRELDTPRRQLTFSIGMPDAVALSHAFRRIPTPRPLTHELMSEVLQRFDIDVVAVRIVGRTGSIHFAELDLRGRNGRSVHSCRPSDALIIALRQPVQVPILIDARLLDSTDDVTPAGAVDH
jgi:uncharacterized protein